MSSVARRYFLGTCIAFTILCSTVVVPEAGFIVILIFVTLSSVLSSIQKEIKA